MQTVPGTNPCQLLVSMLSAGREVASHSDSPWGKGSTLGIPSLILGWCCSPARTRLCLHTPVPVHTPHTYIHTPHTYTLCLILILGLIYPFLYGRQ